MSTRATYTFKDNSHYTTRGQAVQVYIHYDGYPEGAAAYFWDMHHYQDKRGGYATQFLKANRLAELTFGKHGDLEYRYTMDDKTGYLEAEMLVDWDNRSNREGWKTIYSGHYAGFINQYGGGKNGLVKEFEKLYLVRSIEGWPYGSDTGKLDIYKTVSQVRDELETKIASAASYAERHPHFTGNINANNREIADMQKLLFDLSNKAIEEFDVLQNVNKQ